MGAVKPRVTRVSKVRESLVNNLVVIPSLHGFEDKEDVIDIDEIVVVDVADQQVSIGEGRLKFAHQRLEFVEVFDIGPTVLGREIPWGERDADERKHVATLLICWDHDIVVVATGSSLAGGFAEFDGDVLFSFDFEAELGTSGEGITDGD